MTADLETEQKIMAAARRVFLAQGFDGARIRQIADEAGVNLALVNYYFTSKEDLFKRIYLETFHTFLGRLAQLLNEATPLEVKIWKIVDRYTDFLLDNPKLPAFVLSQQRPETNDLYENLEIRSLLESSSFHRQLVDEAAQGRIRPIAPLQVLMTIVGCIVFPVMAQPLVASLGALDDAGYRQFMEDRKLFVPDMIMAYLKNV